MSGSSHWRALFLIGPVASLMACATQGPSVTEPTRRAPVTPQTATAAPPLTVPEPAPLPDGPQDFVYTGELEQGGWIRGQVPAGTQTAFLDARELPLTEDGRFFAGFDRDAPGDAILIAQRADGTRIEKRLTIAPRDWNIERVNVARRSGGPSEAFMRRRRPELAQIVAARDVDAPSDGWRQDFAWPARGRISGRFGSQRIYRGEPGSYHSGLDIAQPTGTPFVAPADGVVTLATTSPFSLEGNLLIIDHGMGLNSAFLHLSEIDVGEGERVTRGQRLGAIGSSGRATGPHLHWSLKWRDARLDPLLFVDPDA